MVVRHLGAAALGKAGLPFVERHLVAADGQRPGDGHQMGRPFGRKAAAVVAHDVAAGRHHHQFGTGRAVAEDVARPAVGGERPARQDRDDQRYDNDNCAESRHGVIPSVPTPWGPLKDR